jgi:hypothetical protein
VHSWIPTITHSKNNSKPWYQSEKDYEYMENWREANDSEWKEAMWGNPFNKFSYGLNKTGKTIVFGHWHCSAGHVMLGHCENEFDSAIWAPCCAEGIIGIDRCTVHTGEVNVIVLEDKFINKKDDNK